MRIHVGVSLLVALILVGCASQPPGTRPDDMSASEHNDHAAAHVVQAKKHEAAYDPNAVASRPTSTTSQNFAWGTETYNPTAVHLEHAKQHREVAEAHHKAAHALETFTEAECSEFPPKTRALCPLMSVVAAEADIEGGAKLTLKVRPRRPPSCGGAVTVAGSAHGETRRAGTQSGGVEGAAEEAGRISIEFAAATAVVRRAALG